MKYKYDIDLFAVLLLLTVTQIAILMIVGFGGY